MTFSKSNPKAPKHGVAKNFKMNMVNLKPHLKAYGYYMKINSNKTVVLGPWVKWISEKELHTFQHHPTQTPIVVFREKEANFLDWQANDTAVRIGIWPTPQPLEHQWYLNRRDLDLQRWKEVEIADTIDMCFALNQGGGNQAPMMAALCFWDTSSNTFNFIFRQMGITMLDLYAITSLPSHAKH